MKTKIDLKNKVKLIPVFMTDENTGYLQVHYKGFLKATGKGKTKGEAQLNLLQILIVLLIEKQEKIRERSLNSYYSN